MKNNQKMQPIKFISPAATRLVKDAVYKKEKYLKEFNDTLEKYGLPTGIDGIFERIEKGYDAELQERMSRCEEYIKNTNCPDFLQENLREKARASIDEDMMQELKRLCDNWDRTLTPEDLELDEEHAIRMSDVYKEKSKKKYEMEIPAHRIPEFEKYRLLVSLAEEIRPHTDIRQVFDALSFGPVTGDYMHYLFILTRLKPDKKD